MSWPPRLRKARCNSASDSLLKPPLQLRRLLMKHLARERRVVGLQHGLELEIRKLFIEHALELITPGSGEKALPNFSVL